MKIVIAGGEHAADYIVKMFKKRSNKLIIINNDKFFAQYIAKANNVAVLNDDPCKLHVLEQANIKDADILIALGEKDTDNYVVSLLAKQVFGVKKCICTVTNPKNVDLYKNLGIYSVISSTHLLATSIESESSLESFIKTMSLEDDKVVLTEFPLTEKHSIVGRKIMEIDFPKIANISCIYRKPNVIIPNGSTVIHAKDILLVVSSKNDQLTVLEYLQKTKK